MLGANPGILRRGTPIINGVSTYYLVNFPRKLHESEEIWAEIERGMWD